MKAKGATKEMKRGLDQAPYCFHRLQTAIAMQRQIRKVSAWDMTVTQTDNAPSLMNATPTADAARNGQNTERLL